MASKVISQLREQNPEFADKADYQIAREVYNQDYSDLEFNDFANRIELSPLDRARALEPERADLSDSELARSIYEESYSDLDAKEFSSRIGVDITGANEPVKDSATDVADTSVTQQAPTPGANSTESDENAGPENREDLNLSELPGEVSQFETRRSRRTNRPDALTFGDIASAIGEAAEGVNLRGTNVGFKAGTQQLVGGIAEGAGLTAQRYSDVQDAMDIDLASYSIAATEAAYERSLSEAETQEERQEVAREYESRLADLRSDLDTSLASWQSKEPGAVANLMRDVGETIQGYAQQTRQDEDFQRMSPIAQDISSGAGSIVPFLSLSLVGNVATRGAGPTAKMIGRYLPALTAASAQGVSDQYQRAIRAGLSEEEAVEKSIQGAPAGALQVAPIASILKPLPAELRGRAIGQIVSIARTGGAEAIAEGGGVTLQNLVEQSYNPERGTWDDSFYNAAIGGIVGSGTQAGVQVATGGDGVNANAQDDVLGGINGSTPGGPTGDAPGGGVPNIPIAIVDQQASARSQERETNDASAETLDFAVTNPEVDPADPASTALEIDQRTEQVNRQVIERLQELRSAGVTDDQIANDDTLAQLRLNAERLSNAQQQLGAQQSEQAANATIDNNRAPSNDALGQQVTATRQEAVNRSPLQQEIQAIRALTQPRPNESVTTPVATSESTPERGTQVSGDQPSAMQQEINSLRQSQRLTNDPQSGIYVSDRVATDQIKIDPETYQFRDDVNAEGIDERLLGIRSFDDLRAGTLILHERENGELFVADGHHRIDLARRLNRESLNAIVLRESDGVSVGDARRFAAERNLSEGNATAIDAAKVFREFESDPSTVIEERDLPRSQVVRDGASIAQLSDDVYGAVINGIVTEKDAAAIGRNFSDPNEQQAALQQFQRAKPINEAQREILANDIKAAGFSQGEQGGLFGDDPTEALIGERMRVQEAITKRFSRRGRLFNTLNQNQGAAEQAGNRIAREQNEAVQQDSSAAIEILRRATTTPSINQAINGAAQRLKDGETITRVVDDLEKEIINEAQRIRFSPQGATSDSGLRQNDQAGVDGRAGQRATAQNAGQEAEGGQQGIPGEEPGVLTQPTPEDLQALDQAAADRQAAELAAEQRAQADAERDDFTLTGSNTEADQAAARGQDSLFETAPSYTVGPESPATALNGATQVELDGVTRPALNSQGLPIHSTVEGVRNFWRWFGESQAVDAQGRPLVLYHGTASSFESFGKEYLGQSTRATSAEEAFFFSDNQEVAESYAEYSANDARVARLIDESNRAQDAGDFDRAEALIIQAEDLDASLRAGEDRAQGQTILPVYVRIANPLVRDAQGEVPVGLDQSISSMIQTAQRRGNDGVIIRNLDDAVGRINLEADHFAVFAPEDIKSAVGNQGTFSQTDDSIVREPSNEQAIQGDLFTLAGADNVTQRAPDSAFNVDGATEVLSSPTGQFGTVTSTRRTNTYSLPDKPILTAADAATATAQVRKNAQENLVALVTDSSGNVLDLIRHSVGDIASASANNAVIAGSVLRVPGAVNVWMSHNHPGGVSSLSTADIRTFNAIRELTSGSGISVRGILAIGDTRYSSRTTGEPDINEAEIPPARRTRQISVSERTLQRRAKLGRQINTPSSAIQAAKDLGKSEAGVVLLSNRNAPVAWVPVSLKEMAAMRGTGVLDRLLVSIERSNSTGAIISTGKGRLEAPETQKAIANMQRFFADARVRAIDSVSVEPEIALSENPLTAEDIESLRPEVFFSRAERNAPGLSASETMRYVDGLMSDWQNAPEVIVAQSDSDLPASLQNAINAAKAQGQIRGVFVNSKVYIVADNNASRAEVEETVFHEVIRHYGMREILGDDYNDFMDQVYIKVGRSAVEPFAAYNNVDLDSDNASERRRARRNATEELLAHTSEAELGPRLWNRLIKLITQWLRRMGFRIQMTGAEIRDVIQRAKMYVEGGEFVTGTSVVEKHSLYRGTRHEETLDENQPAFMRREEDPDLEEAKVRAGLGGRRRPLGDWVQNLQALSHAKIRDYSRELSHALRQGSVDRFHGIKRIEQQTVGNIPAEQSAYVSARLSTGIASTMRAILHHGAPEWSEGSIRRIEGSKGLLEILEPVRGDIDTFLGWMVSRRAERLMSEDRENLFEPRHIQALREAGESSPLFDKFEQVARDLDAFKKAILDIAEGAGMIDPDGRKAWDQSDYIPFYRIADDSPSAAGPSSRRSLSGQSSGIRTLRGGVERLNDPLENLIMNFTHLMDASMKNDAILKLRDNLAGFQGILEEVGPDYKAEMIPMNQVEAQIIRSGGDPSVIPKEAMEGLAKMWAMKPPADDDVIRLMDNGKARYYRVLDPLLLKSLTAVHDTGLQGLPLDFMRWTKRLLTRGVTASPEFMARNYIRDMMHAWTISEDKFRLGVDSVRGAYKTLTNQGGTIDMMFAGGSFLGGYVNATDPNEVARATRQALRQRGYAASSANAFLSTVIDTPLKAWESYTRIGDSVENSSREAVYEAARQSGRSRTESVFMAKDLMDYSMRGSNSAIQFLTDVVPFLNARLQGLYKLGRAGASNPGSILAKGSVIMLATLALKYDNMDDERYEDLEDWDKDTYWHFFAPDWMTAGPQHIRIPKPFEIGVLFGTIPERIAANAMNQEGSDRTYERMLWSLKTTFSFNPIPQAVYPTLEVFANRNTFTQAPIENLSDQNKLPEARVSPYTSETMVALGQVTGPSLGLSPKELQHLWRGYTGTLGMYALDAADIVSRKLQNKPPKPAMRIDRMPVVGSFVRSVPASRTQYQTDLYDLFNKTRQIQRTIDTYVEDGDFEKAQELYEKSSSELFALPDMKRATQDLGEIRKEITQIYESRDMTPEEKRDAIDELIALRNEITRSQMKDINEFIDREDPLKED